MTGADRLPAAASGRPAAQQQGSPLGQGISELRLTSVLFGDLVNFTALSEQRDPEEVRELLSRYFDTVSVLVARYGGTVEKFIGDAVMAVWGVPSAHEDDAERAVRVGLDLTVAVAALGEEIGVAGLAMRVGVITGEVAVTLGADGEGMVAGDAVNTAARVQAIAPAGAVWVDESTRALTAAAVTYTEAGRFLVRGRDEPLALYEAGRVVAGVGGVQRVDGLEAPFTGRDRELRLVKELFHACAEEGRPRLVAVSGAAGIGKSRLGWEFYKYLDGVSSEVWWHRGRCLSYGDGVAFHALAEMVRSRLDVVDGDSAEVVGQKLTAGLARHIPDASEREWLAPRIAALLGGTAEDATGTAAGREEHFPAWRVFFERVSAGKPLVLLVEDLQWADSGLLDFVEHVLDTSRAALFVLTLARPELEERRVGWATGRRATRLRVEPLADGPMGVLVDGLVAGLPEASRRVLVARSEGVPLYAVETVRALIDRDAVVASGGHYVLAPGAADRVDVATLGAPPSLQALLSARLDALPPAERRLLRDATVLGLTFSPDSLAAFGYTDETVRTRALQSLARREFLSLDSDPRSPERGNYRFVQTLVRTVAYETLSRRDRRTRHLAIAEALEAGGHPEEIASVIATHYLEAHAASTDPADTAKTAAAAVRWLERGAERAGELGSPAEAQAHFEKALSLVTDDADIARLAGGAARNARLAGLPDIGMDHALRSRDAFLRLGEELQAASATAEAADALITMARIEQAIELLEPVHHRLAGRDDARDALLDLDIPLMRAHLWAGNFGAARKAGEEALRLGEALQAWPRLARSLTYFGAVLLTTGQPVTGFAMLEGAAELSRRHGLVVEELPALNNIAAFSLSSDLNRAVETARRGLGTARHLGHRVVGDVLLATFASALWLSGDWDELAELTADFEDVFAPSSSWATLVTQFYSDLAATSRGQAITVPAVISGDDVRRSVLLAKRATAAAAEGQIVDWVEDGTAALELTYGYLGISDDFHSIFMLAVEGSLAAGRWELADKQIDLVRSAAPNEVTPLLRALLLRLEANLLAGRLAAGEIATAAQADAAREIESGLRAAVSALRDFGSPYWLGRALLDAARWHRGNNRDEAAAELAREAEEIFRRLGAGPRREQAHRLIQSTVGRRVDVRG